MNLRINRSIAEQTKVSYAIESAGPLPYDIDCGEGINTVMVPPAAKQAFKELDFEMMRPYPHSVDVKDSIIQYWKDYCSLNYKRIVQHVRGEGVTQGVRRQMLRQSVQILTSLREHNFETEVGPGVYDIHSPRVPSVEEIVAALHIMLTKIDSTKLWVNPDCGLKTRGIPETEESLKHMVEAAKVIRKDV